MITMSQLSSINFPRTATVPSGEQVPNNFVLDTVINAIIGGFPQKVILGRDFLISVFVPAFFADDDACRVLDLDEPQAKVWEENRDHMKFGAETGINGQMVMPIYYKHDNSEKVEQLVDTRLAISSFSTYGVLLAAFDKFLELLNKRAYELTPNYGLYGAKQYRKDELVTIRTTQGGDAFALVRHIFPDVQTDNDATIYDMIVTPVGTNRMVRVHSIDILPLGYTKSMREVEEERLQKAASNVHYRQDVLVELMRMLPKDRTGGVAQHERKIPQNTAQGIMGFGAAPKR